MLKYVRNKEVAHDVQLSVSLMLLPHFDVFYDPRKHGIYLF